MPSLLTKQAPFHSKTTEDAERNITRIAASTASALNKAVLDGREVEASLVVATATTVFHGLGRLPRGAFAILAPSVPAAVFTVTSWDDSAMLITSTATGTFRWWVF